MRLCISQGKEGCLFVLEVRWSSAQVESGVQWMSDSRILVIWGHCIGISRVGSGHTAGQMNGSAGLDAQVQVVTAASRARYLLITSSI